MSSADTLLRRTIGALLIALAGAVAASAQESVGEYQVKLAFIYNFVKFVEWPASAFASAEAPFGVCVLGEDPTSADIEAVLKGKAMGPHLIDVRRLRAG